MRDKVRILFVAASVVAITVTGSAIATADSGHGAKSSKAKKAAKKKKKKKKKTTTVEGRQGIQGPQGPQGATGANGTNGTNGTPGAPGADATHVSSNWGVITRNTTGSGIAYLRDGPFGSFGVVGPTASPPEGSGSLGIGVENTQKVSFGNEVDYFGDPVGGLTDVGFHVFQTDENSNIPTNDASQGNLPNITLEIDPNIAANPTVGYSSMVFNPPALTNAEENQWSPFINADLASPPAQSGWWFTNGATAATTGCSQASFCSLAQAQAALAADDGTDTNPASIYSVAVGKGTDHRWVGAVDALRLNAVVIDFNADGVREVAP